jgi:tetratricopeptide (TPR) repeat protein
LATSISDQRMKDSTVATCLETYAGILLDQGKIEEAIRAMRRASRLRVELNYTRAAPRYSIYENDRLNSFLMLAKRWDLAQQGLEQAEQRSEQAWKKRADVLIQLAYVYLMKNDFSKAASTVREARAACEQDRWIETNERSGTDLLVLGYLVDAECKLHQNRLLEATPIFEKALSILATTNGPHDISLKPLCEDYIDSLKAHNQKEQCAKAQALFNRVRFKPTLWQ